MLRSTQGCRTDSGGFVFRSLEMPTGSESALLVCNPEQQLDTWEHIDIVQWLVHTHTHTEAHNIVINLFVFY